MGDNIQTKRISSREDLGVALRALRKQQRLTQEDVVLAAGVTRKVVSKAETGHGTVTVDSLLRIVSALSVDLSLLSRSDLIAHLPSEGDTQ